MRALLHGVLRLGFGGIWTLRPAVRGGERPANSTTRYFHRPKIRRRPSRVKRDPSGPTRRKITMISGGLPAGPRPSTGPSYRQPLAPPDAWATVGYICRPSDPLATLKIHVGTPGGRRQEVPGILKNVVLPPASYLCDLSGHGGARAQLGGCLLYTSPSPRD